MLIAVQHLVDRMRHPRSRADEVAALRHRFAVTERAGADEIALGASMRRLREALVAALAGVTSCSGCARKHPLPHGRWDGGHCCGTETTKVFTDDEVAALRDGGTTPAHLVPPRSDHAGCAFRGPTGCSLAVADRPNICVRFICLELEGELRDRGDLKEIRAVAAALNKAFEAHRKLRSARREAEDREEPWADD